MANVIAPHHPQFQFNPSVTHSPLPAAPSPVIMAGWNPLHHSATHHASPARVQKRRMDPEDDEDTGRRDVSMDRSPTPERVKRAPPKRLRMVPSSEIAGRDGRNTKDNKAPGNDIDIGVLLGEFCFGRNVAPALTHTSSHIASTVVAAYSYIPHKFATIVKDRCARSYPSSYSGHGCAGYRTFGQKAEGCISLFKHIGLRI